MAIIDYKEKYEKAVQAAMLAKQDTESAVTIGILEEIFPELKESEDERVRKEIISAIKEDWPGHTDWIAWLEAQGEQKPADTEKGAKGNEVEIPFSEPPLTLKHAKEVMGIKQNHAWSEEDEKFVHGLIRGLSAKRDIHGHTTFSSDGIDITKTIDWLKSLKERYTWKPSEEQIKALDSAIHCYAGISPTNNREVYALEIMKEQLKKLRGE